MTTALTQSQTIQDVAGAIRAAHERGAPIAPVREQLGDDSLITEEVIPLPIVEITLVQGRPADARLALMKEITDAVERTLGAPRQSIRVIIREVPPFHFAVAGEPKGPPPEENSPVKDSLG